MNYSKRPSAFLKLSWRLFKRNLRNGEVRLFALAMLLAVASMTAVDFFTERAGAAMNRQASQLLGADLVLSSDHVIADRFVYKAKQDTLNTASSIKFPSMAIKAGDNVLVEAKAVSVNYPLRGELQIAADIFGTPTPVKTIPQPGSVWVDEKLYSALKVNIGDYIVLGEAQFKVAAIIKKDPDIGMNFLSLGPSLILNQSDLATTKLIQAGSRINYRLFLAGEAEAIKAYRIWADKNLEPGQRLESIREARPETRNMLERAERFLGLASLLSVVLAAVAIALTMRRFVERNLDTCALLRCFGASHAAILGVYILQFVILAGSLSVLGCVLGYAAQSVLANLLSSALNVELANASVKPVFHGLGIGLVMFLGLALPPLIALARVPTLRILRRELTAPPVNSIFVYLLAVGMLCALVLWKVSDIRLASYVIGAFGLTLIFAALITIAIISLLKYLPIQGGLVWRYATASLRRRIASSTVQIVALALGIMVLLTLTLTRDDLLGTWKRRIPTDAPNYFLINIQPEQLSELHKFFRERGINDLTFLPMVRGRLVAINDRKVSSKSYTDDRAKRLVDREFNLSWASHMQPHNQLVSGVWWGQADTGKSLFSVEQGIAQTLGIKLNDVLTYDIGGNIASGKVANLRKVNWDSFQVNFFVIAAPGILDDFQATYITSFHVVPKQRAIFNALVKQFPNVLVIDVASILNQIQTLMDQLTRGVEFIFLFTMLAGFMVLYAALNATYNERFNEIAVLQALGARKTQVLKIQAAEFIIIGTVAGILAAVGATALSYILATRIFTLEFTFDPGLWIISIIFGTVAVAAAGVIGIYKITRIPPNAVLSRVN